MGNQDESLDTIAKAYANMLADITIGKNAKQHLPVIEDCIKILHEKIDNELLTGKDGAGFMKVAYWFYKLKDDALALLP